MLALDAAGVPAVLGGAFDEAGDVASVVCQRIESTYRSGHLAYPEGETSEIHKRRGRPDALAHSLPPVIPNILKVGDLPELVACILPRPVVLGGAEPLDAYAGLERFGLKLKPGPLTEAELLEALRLTGK
ncbi:MAG: hypothetical protein H5T86_03345 [Armatimonadetes bacterium]|nr:hypothetical protein [Armatimonadota bacterium]